MPRAKRKSDEVYNARRRAKRLAARIERDMERQTSSERAASRAYLDTIRAQIAKTYTPRKGSPAVRSALAAEAASSAEELDRMTRGVRSVSGRTGRANRLFSQQINAARLEKASMFGRMGSEQVSIFYAATRNIWQGRDPRKRNEYIMEALGTSSLEEAFRRVIRENRTALRVAAHRGAITSKVPGVTAENAFFYNEVSMDSERIGSPLWEPYINLVG